MRKKLHMNPFRTSLKPPVSLYCVANGRKKERKFAISVAHKILFPSILGVFSPFFGHSSRPYSIYTVL